jgi:histidinol dehydrogenase
MPSEDDLFPLPRIDATNGLTSQGSAAAQLADLRRRLSPEGNVISAKGKELTRRVFGQPLAPQDVVRRICDDIQKEGTPALLRYCAALDNATMTADQVRVPIERLQTAHRQAKPEYLDAIRRIRKNIVRFQSAIVQRDVLVEPSPGVRLHQPYVPLRRVGICVPGGAAAYPSTVLMTAVLAQTAGVQEIAIVAPPTPLGAYNPDVLACCWELGITEVHAIGGAQAVAALAYGTDCVSPVDKIVGPGNLFVALAKRHVYGHVDIDSIAGPSEVVVIADQSAPPAYAAADMLAQAEHSPGSSVLITWDQTVMIQILRELRRQVNQVERANLTIEALQAFGACVLVRDADQACQIANDLAPEHLHIATTHPHALLDKIHHAGAIFLGHFSPVALGDYAAGPSHVLPTGGTARWAAGLSVNDFLRGGSVIEYTQEALTDIAPAIQVMANKEGLTAHRESVHIRTTNR